MESSEKIERLLKDDWEIHGDPKSLCLLLRDHVLATQRMIEYVAEITNDEWAKQYIQWRIKSKNEQAAIVLEENSQVLESMIANVPPSKDRVCDHNDEAAVYAWLYNKGECPDDAAFCAQLVHLAVEWKDQRSKGMDVIASNELKVLALLASAMRDI